MWTTSLLERLSSAGPTLLPIFLDAALKGAAILLLTALAALLLRQSSAAARHLLWFLGVLGVLILPVLSIALPQWHILPRWRSDAPAAQIQAPQADGPAMAPAPAILPPPPRAWIVPDAGVPAKEMTAPALAPISSAPPPAPPHLTWQARVLLAWLAGSGLLLGYVALGFLSLAWLEHRAARITEGPWPALLRQLSVQLALRRPVRLLSSPRRTMPMTWGLWRPRVLLPADCQIWNEPQCRAVLLHELAHAKRRDCLTQLVTQLACALYWFNPLLWLAWRQMQAERERACDDLVLGTGTRASAYAEQLLHIASALPAERFTTAAIAMARPSKLEGRLRAILDPTRNRRVMTWSVTVLAVLLVGAFVVPVAMLGAADEAAPPSPKPPSAAPATQPAQTRGRVVDIHNQPIAGAELHMNNSPWSAVSDTEGWFPLPDSEIGALLRLRVRARGFVERRSAHIQRLEDGKLNPAGGVIQLDRVGRLEGRIIGPDGKPLAAAPLLMFTYTREGFAGGTAYGTSDAQGHFVIENVPPGTLVLCSSPAKKIGAAKLLQLRDGQVISGLVLDLSKSIVTSDGRIVDQNGKPLAGVKISLGWQAKGASAAIGDVWSTSTNPQGRYRLDKLPPGQWIFVANIGTAYAHTEPVTLSDTPVHLPDLALPVVLTASGRVRRVQPMWTTDTVREWIDATQTGDTQGVAAVVVPQSAFARNSARIVPILPQIKHFPISSGELNPDSFPSHGKVTTNTIDLGSGHHTPLTFKLIRQSGQWRISDVVDDKGTSLMARPGAPSPSTTQPAATQPGAAGPRHSARFREMQELLQAALLYFNEHRGHWPATLEEVRPYLSTVRLYLPKDVVPDFDAYIYKAPPPLAQDEQLPVLVEKDPSRPDGRYIGFANWHVRFIKPAAAQKLLAEFGGAATQPATTRAASAQTVTFTFTRQEPGHSDETSKQMIKDGRSRTELPDGRVMIQDTAQGKQLYIEPEQKTATLSNQLHLAITNIPKLANPGRAAVVSLGKKQIDGHLAEGIRFTAGAETRTVWRDPTTRRPVRIEIDVIDPTTHKPLHGIFSDIVFDAPLDDALFALKAPEGYETRKAPVPIKVENIPATEPTTQSAATQPVTPATLDFRIAAEIGEGDTPQGNRLPRPLAEHLVASLQKQGPAAKASRPPGFDWFAADDQAYPHRFITGRHGGQRYILLMTQAPYVMLAGKPGRHTWGLKRAYLDQDGEGQTAIGFELDAVGAERFGKLTESNLDRPLAMLIDGKVISAPTIRSKITHTGMIAGGLDGFDPAWARQAAEALTQGMPPAPSPTTAPNER